MSETNLPQSDEQNPGNLSYLAALSVLCIVFHIYGLNHMPFIGPDEPRYGEVALEMFRSGDWITPRLGGINWFEKPALTFWLSTMGFTVFGVSEFAARIGIAVTATLGVMLLYFFGSQIRSRLYGYLSASVLATTGLWVGFARGATFDMPLSVAMELALLSFYLWIRKPVQTARDPLFLVFSFSMGLAVLAKGLVGLVLPSGILVVFLILSGHWKKVLKPGIVLTGIIVFLATAAVWYVPVILRHGWEFIDEFFIAHHFQRYISNKYRHPQPFYFYFLVTPAGSFPWVFFLISRLYRSIREWRSIFNYRASEPDLFLWLWILIPVLFFSFSGSKLPGYILPVYPALALLIGKELERWWTEEKAPGMSWIVPATVVVLFALALFIGLGSEKYFGLNMLDGFRVAAFTILVAIAYLGTWFLIGGRAATYILPFGMALVMLIVINVFSPMLSERESVRDIVTTAKNSAGTGERLVFYVNHDQGINYYATGLPVRDERSELVTVVRPHEVAAYITKPEGSILVMSPRRWSVELEQSALLKTEKLAEQRGGVACSPNCDWILFRIERAK